jgi:uncharacterized protein YbjT (DUF2867 family)
VRILVTGASGFVGSRLVAALEGEGHEVRAMTRRPERYEGAGRPIAGDVGDEGSLRKALEGCEVAYYLVHSLDDPDLDDPDLDDPDFERKDADAARAFARAAAAAETDRIVYLGGLGQDSDQLSRHLGSRREVERLLGGTGVPVTVLRAGIVVGHGGVSWELTRQLVAHLPAMVTPPVGQHAHATDRGRRRRSIPDRCPRRTGGRRAGVRGGGPGGAHLPADDDPGR